MIGSVSDARVIDVVLHLMCAQGRVVRQEARTRYTVEVDDIECEADRFNQYSVSWFMKGMAQLLRIEAPPVRSWTTLLLEASGKWEESEHQQKQE